MFARSLVLKGLGLLLLALSLVPWRVPVAKAADTAPPPPYMVHIPEGIVAWVSFDEARVRKLVPSELKIAPGATGMVHVYTASSPGMLGDYTATYITVDVEGYDSPAGFKGRYMLAGLYGPSERATRAFTGMGFPVRNGSNQIVAMPDTKKGVASLNGSTFLTVEVKPKPEPCNVIGATVNYVNGGRGSAVQPWTLVGTFQLCNADPVALNISAPASDPIGQIGPLKVLGASVFRDLSVSFPPAPSR